MKLHLGCGSKYLHGYINIDIQSTPTVDLIADITNLHQNSRFIGKCEEIYACHVLEHLGRHNIQTTINNWYLLLKPEGVIRIAVPDIEKVCSMYVNNNCDLTKLHGFLWGGQRDKYDYHNIGFDFSTLSTVLYRAGFEKVQRYDWRTFLPKGFDDYSRSYIPHMDFEGALMSLNVVAYKPQSESSTE